jgi:hypothetical protein
MNEQIRPIDVLAVLGRHVSLAEQVACLEQVAEAHAVFDAITELIEAARVINDYESDKHNDTSLLEQDAMWNRLNAALANVGSAK